MNSNSSEPPFINSEPSLNEGKPLPKNVNVSEATPLRDFALLMAGVCISLLILYWAFGFLGESLAVHTPLHWEQKLFQTSKYFSKLPQIPVSAPLGSREEKIFAKLVPVFHRESTSRIVLNLAVFEDSQLNAFAFPGGWILVSRGLSDKVKTETGLAFVLGHELGHFFYRDHLRGLGRGMGMALLGSLLGFSDTSYFAPKIIETLVARSHSREQESRADAFALKLLAQVYPDLSGAEEFFKVALEEANPVSKNWPTLFSTHPHPEERRTEILRLIREKTK